MTTLRMVSVVLLALVCLVSAAFSDDQPLSVPPAAPLTDCQIGNLNLPVPPPVSGIFVGNEIYAYFVYPLEQCNCPEQGFQLENVNMYLELTPDQVPVSFGVFGGLREAIYDPSIGQWVPGDPLCESPIQVFSFDEPGLYVITVPMMGACGCFQLDDFYFLFLQYVDPFFAELPIDDQPQAGVAYRYNGMVWQDLDGILKAANGKIIVWGDLICCLPPVGTEPGTWGQIKSLYR